MYLEDKEIENLYGEFRNEGVAPPPEAKDFVMNNIGQKSYWRFLWIFLLVAGAGATAYFIFPFSKSPDFESVVALSSDDSNLNNDPSMNQDNGIVLSGDDKFKKQDEEVLHATNDTGLKIQDENELDHENLVNQKNDLVDDANLKDNASNLSPNAKNLNKMVQKKSYQKAPKKKELDQKDLAKNDLNSKVAVPKKADPISKKKQTIGKTNLDENQNLNHNKTLLSNKIEENNMELQEEELNKINPLLASEFPYSDEKYMRIDLRNIKKPKIITFGLEAQLGYSFSDVLTKKNDLTYDNIGLVRNLNTFEAGINGIMNVKSFLIKTGIGYQKDFSTTNYTDEIFQIRRTVAYEVVLDSNNNPIQNPLYSFYDTATVVNNYQLLIQTSYFTVPLQFGYQFKLKNRWNIEVLAGARFAFLMNVDSKYRSPQSMDYLQSVDHGMFQKFRMDAMLDVSVNYQLTENWSIGLNLPFSMGMNSRIRSSKMLNYRLGGMLNFRYNF